MRAAPISDILRVFKLQYVRKKQVEIHRVAEKRDKPSWPPPMDT